MTLTKPLYKNPATYINTMRVRENTNDYNSRKLNKRNRTRLLKRIPLNRLMDLKVDCAFKQLFGNEKNKDITVVFLNAILQKTGRNRITDISFQNIETGGEYMDDKVSRLDLLVLTDADEWINVEIQFSNEYDMIKRTLYYWARVYADSFQKGMRYNTLRPVIAINIVNFNLIDQTERFHTSYHLYEDEEMHGLTNVMEFHFIEMTKLIKAWKDDKLDPWNDVLARWLLLLGMVDHRNSKVYDDIYSKLEEIAMTDESLREAFGDWEELSMTQEQRMVYEARLKHILDEESARLNKEEMERNTKRLRKEVEQKEKNAKKLKREAEHQLQEATERIESLARGLLTKGMNLNYVAEATGLTKERVMEIKSSMKK